MALLVTFPTATVLNSAYQLIPIRFIETAPGSLYKLRFVVKIKDTSDNELAILTMKPNLSGSTAQGTINLQEIAKAYVEDVYERASQTVHIVAGKQGSKGLKGAIRLRLDAGYRSSATETGAVTTTYTNTNQNLFVCNFRPDAKQVSTTAKVGDFNLTQTSLGSTAARALTEAPRGTNDIPSSLGFYTTGWSATPLYEQYVTDTGWRTLGIYLGSNSGGGYNIGSQADRFALAVIHDGAIVDAIQDVQFSSESGVASTAVDADNELQYFFGFGPSNLALWSTLSSTIKTALADGDWDDIIVQYFNGARSVSTVASGIYRFRRDPACGDLNTVQTVGFVNRVGGWDAIDFTRKKTRKIAREKEISYTRSELDFSTYVAPQEQSYEGGRTVLEQDYRESVTMTSDWVNENQNLLFESLFVSPNIVFVNDQFDVLGYHITDKSWTERTVANDKQIRYTITFTANKAATV